ncbi:MAG: hypothetical protein ABW321_26790 [Polyangiales bacterium]
MMRIQHRSREAMFAIGALSIVFGASACERAQAIEPRPVTSAAQQLELGELARECGFVCPGERDTDGIEVKGIVDGNASISGVAAIDGVFSSVINYENAAQGVSDGIDAQLEAIRADFQLPAGGELGELLKGVLELNLETGFGFQVQPAVCKADLKAEFDAAARCDASVTPGEVSVACEGGCQVEAKADVSCDADVDLYCTVSAPDFVCNGQCTGTCSVEVDGQLGCEGTCNGECSGECSAYVKNASGEAVCQGKCSGKCKGHCDVQVSAEANCEGTCSGECTLKNPAGGCEGGIRAECRAEANAAISCDTQCDGKFEPPQVKAECQAKVHADAQLKVRCTPPHVAFNYRLRASLQADLEARLRFESALKTLIDVRLPALKVAVAQSDAVAEAGGTLARAAVGAVLNTTSEIRDRGGIDIKVAFGMGCAVQQLEYVEPIVDRASRQLNRSVDAAKAVNAALKI